MGQADFLYDKFLGHFQYEPTESQDTFLHQMAEFLTGDDGDRKLIFGSRADGTVRDGQTAGDDKTCSRILG